MSVAYSPAPARVANQIYVQATATKMIAQCAQGGKSIAHAIDWAASELNGFSRRSWCVSNAARGSTAPISAV